MPRPRKIPAETAARSIMEAFWEKGFDSTSLADLMAATGLKKGSLYNAYGDKSRMFQMALLKYDSDMVAGMIETMDGMSGPDAITAFLTAPTQAAETGDRRGCLLCNSMGEYQNLDNVARQIVHRTRAQLERAIHRALQRSDKAAAGLEPGELQALYFGMQIMVRGGVSAEQLDAIAQRALARI